MTFLQTKLFFPVGALAMMGLLVSFPKAHAAKMRMGGLTIGPYASVSSTKGIKPKKDATGSNEVATQRTSYGLRVGLNMGRFFSLGVDAGTNKIDVTKKAVATRDEYGEIDFQKDLDTSPSHTNDYRLQETQYLGKAVLNVHPLTTKILTVKVGAGVRARQRLIKVTDSVVTENSKEVTTPITYNAVAEASLQARLLKAFSANIKYSFVFIKFPETQPHEQEVSIGFGFIL